MSYEGIITIEPGKRGGQPLFDHHLSPSLAQRLSDLFPESEPPCTHARAIIVLFKKRS